MEEIRNEMEIVEIEENDYEEAEMTNERSGIGTGTAVLIGAGITAAAIAVGKAVRKAWKNHKAKKEQAKVIELQPEDYNSADDSKNDD